MKFLAIIVGGQGPDVWDKEIVFDATDFMDAADEIAGQAEEMGGSVSLLESNDWPGMTDSKRIDAIKRIGIELVPRRGKWNALIADCAISQRGVATSEDIRQAIDQAIAELDAAGEKSYHIE